MIVDYECYNCKKPIVHRWDLRRGPAQIIIRCKQCLTHQVVSVPLTEAIVLQIHK